jgi:hypothetical protein
VTDTENAATIKTFEVVVECTDAIPAPSLNNPSSAIQIVEGSEVGTWNFSVDPNAISGGQDFQFAWDFNGDGVFDPFANVRDGSNQLFTSNNALNNIYANVENNVNVGIQIMNSCFKSTTYYVDKDLASSHPVARNASSQATNTGYYYLQGDMVHTGGDSSPAEVKRKTRDYLATDNGTYTQFDCDYVWPNNGGTASLQIDTLKRYRALDMALHGMSLDIDNIQDNGNPGNQTISTDQADLNNVRVNLAGENDGLIQADQYNRMGACEVQMRLIKAESMVPCSNGTPRLTQSIEILGEFTCPTLVNGDGDTLSVTNGKFFCGDSRSDRCQGGGGGGGGQPPPQF